MTSQLAVNRCTRPLILFGIVTVAAVAFSFIPSPWTAWQPALCFPNCFCEAIRPGLVRQPVNTYTNLVYILAGLLIAFTAQPAAPRLDPQPPLIQSHAGYAFLYGGAVVSIGMGSLFYHASLTLAGQFFDWVGIYAFIGFVVIYNAARFVARPVPGFIFGALYIVLLGLLYFNFFVNPHQRISNFQNLVLLGVGLEVATLLIRRPQIQLLYLVGAIGCLVAAFLIWQWNLDGRLCAPEGLWQGHALWHLVTAAATVLLYPYYLSEQPR